MDKKWSKSGCALGLAVGLILYGLLVLAFPHTIGMHGIPAVLVETLGVCLLLCGALMASLRWVNRQ